MAGAATGKPIEMALFESATVLIPRPLSQEQCDELARQWKLLWKGPGELQVKVFGENERK